MLCPLGRRGAGSCQSEYIVFLKEKVLSFVRTEGDKDGVVTSSEVSAGGQRRRI